MAHTGLLCGCWLASSARWVLFFSSSEPSLWADAIPSASSTCQMPSPALMADVLLDAIPTSALAPACITVHFPASPPPPLCSAKPLCQRLSAVKEFCHCTTPPHRHKMFLVIQGNFGKLLYLLYLLYLLLYFFFGELPKFRINSMKLIKKGLVKTNPGYFKQYVVLVPIDYFTVVCFH